jgi:GNAT superfamily N-acetyltransferase
MRQIEQDFLIATLGMEGAKALLKAVEREPSLAGVLMPRAILGWLTFTAENEYEGSIPGLDNSYVEFQKSEEGFSGSISLDSGIYSFERASLYHLAASMAMALGLEPNGVDSRIRDTVLVKLGESIDTLAKAQVLMHELKLQKSLQPQRMTTHGGYHIEHGGQGATPYSVIHTRTQSPVQGGIASLKDAQGIADWHQNRYKGYFTPNLGKAVLDPSSGYKINHEHHNIGGDLYTRVTAHAPTGEVVGDTLLAHKGGNLVAEGVQVHPEHRRKGIASAMYNHAQSVTGKTMMPSHDQTPMGRALWQGNVAHPQFGQKPAQAQPQKLAASEMDKVELPGQSQKPIPPQGPQMANPPTMQPKKTAPKLPSLSVGKNEALRSCGMCGGQNFRDNRFVGCLCYASLSKGIKTTAYGDGFVLEFERGTDPEVLRALMKEFKR